MNWLTYSGIWCTIIVNPLHWSFSWVVVRRDELSGYDMLNFQLFFLNIKIIIDNGDW